jgi:hypothetical protein
MEQTSNQFLQNKAYEMVACLEFIKLNIKSESKYGRIASGKNKLAKWLCQLDNFTPIYVNVAFWIFIIHIIFF